MKIVVLNNRKVKRNFSNGLWFKKGMTFSIKHSKYIMFGIFGFIITIFYGKPLSHTVSKFNNSISKLAIAFKEFGDAVNKLK